VSPYERALRLGVDRARQHGDAKLVAAASRELAGYLGAIGAAPKSDDDCDCDDPDDRADDDCDCDEVETVAAPAAKRPAKAAAKAKSVPALPLETRAALAKMAERVAAAGDKNAAAMPVFKAHVGRGGTTMQVEAHYDPGPPALVFDLAPKVVAK
jgi:hypothetical protein